MTEKLEIPFGKTLTEPYLHTIFNGPCRIFGGIEKQKKVHIMGIVSAFYLFFDILIWNIFLV